MIANRLIVDASIHDAFVERLVERVRALAVGDPSDPATDLGPVINSSQLEDIQDKLRRARDEGAQQLTAGEASGPAGLTLPPHVLLGTNDVTTAREEVFGPVITVIQADGDEDALRIANDTEYGLSSAVFTEDRLYLAKDVPRPAHLGRRRSNHPSRARPRRARTAAPTARSPFSTASVTSHTSTHDSGSSTP